MAVESRRLAACPVLVPKKRTTATAIPIDRQLIQSSVEVTDNSFAQAKRLLEQFPPWDSMFSDIRGRLEIPDGIWPFQRSPPDNEIIGGVVK